MILEAERLGAKGILVPVVETKAAAAKGAAIVIWTTTPWTIPGNRLVAYGKDITYDVVLVKASRSTRLERVSEAIRGGTNQRN